MSIISASKIDGAYKVVFNRTPTKTELLSLQLTVRDSERTVILTPALYGNTNDVEWYWYKWDFSAHDYTRHLEGTLSDLSISSPEVVINQEGDEIISVHLSNVSTKADVRNLTYFANLYPQEATAGLMEGQSVSGYVNGFFTEIKRVENKLRLYALSCEGTEAAANNAISVDYEYEGTEAEIGNNVSCVHDIMRDTFEDFFDNTEVIPYRYPFESQEVHLINTPTHSPSYFIEF